MRVFTAIMLVLLTACAAALVVEAFELRKQNMILAVKLDGLEDRMNYQMQLRHKLQQAEPFAMPENGTIEYTHPIYRIPEGNK